jgi:hypothetical protein
MDATLWTGGGTSDVNVVNAAGFAPDLAWYKDRTTGLTWHQLVDSVRGDNLALASNRNDQQYNILNNGYTGRKFVLNSNGFTVNDSFHAPTGDAMVGWQWNAGGTTVTNTTGSISSQVRANTSSGFSIVTYTGNGTAGATVGHGLGVAPAMMIVKSRTDAYDWFVYFRALGATQRLLLNTTNAATTSAWLNNTHPSSTVFTLNGSSFPASNANSVGYVAYVFAQIAGYSSFGAYTGNGNADGTFVYTGFRPELVIVKADDTDVWLTLDSSRDTFNVASKLLQPQSDDAEQSVAIFDFLSNGFKLRASGNPNKNGISYLYMAFAQNPFKYSLAR